MKRKNPGDIFLVSIWVIILITAIYGGITQYQEFKSIKCSRYKMNVSQVMMHDDHHYTFFVERDNGMINKYTFRYSNPKIFHDVPKRKPMFIEYKRCISPKKLNKRVYDYTKLISIHLHSATEINGGGWDHGKFGHGQTSVLR